MKVVRAIVSWTSPGSLQDWARSEAYMVSEQHGIIPGRESMSEKKPRSE